MAVTDEQVAALHAQLAGRAEEHKRLLQQLDRAKANEGYSALVAAAFFEAAERRFIRAGEVADKAEVIDFVGSIRARAEENVDLIDPEIAERMILHVIGQTSNEEVRSFDAEVAFKHQIILMAALVGEAQFSDEELDAFIVKVRADAEDLFE
ncbi:hypothetical protein D0T12_27200 [Actinomadura spongiicola]|uniref:Uncharacterized protein n=1 Tax=Actinomadura spongiicola TaxID=2303421 RepID=A0A372GAW8_9ACTN|nr:hypothetical protein [Actinomadura spongiicola]RFS82487.1 hypothetical protein D0T12_27200 [Actinomadura spongiicola]